MLKGSLLECSCDGELTPIPAARLWHVTETLRVELEGSQTLSTVGPLSRGETDALRSSWLRSLSRGFSCSSMQVSDPSQGLLSRYIPHHLLPLGETLLGGTLWVC